MPVTLSTSQTVGEIGYGLMGFTWRPNPAPEEQAFAAMRTALANGANLWNGAEFYGSPENNSLTLLNKYFAKYPEDAEKVVLSIKGCFSATTFAPDNSETGIRSSVDNCIKLLGPGKKIDFFELTRVDPNVPIEDAVKTLAALIKEGKIGGYMLCEVSEKTIRAAHAVHPVSGVEQELSVWTADVLADGSAAACAELGIPIIAYSPIGRGMLTGEVKSFDDLPEGDIRRILPRFQPDVFDLNLKLVDELKKLAAKKNVTPAQLAISWVKARHLQIKGLTVIPNPGATTGARVTENIKSKDVEWTQEDEKEVNNILSSFEIKGGRYPDAFKPLLNV